ncbi:glycosyltransferase family 4 protein [Buchananella felis]|uniref:glycosyltransferase family 4 protein n=1 Tax=Buchananella felis TaxID=3231492 RepID=UPI003527FAB7
MKAKLLPAAASAALSLVPLRASYRFALGAAQVAANQGNPTAAWFLFNRVFRTAASPALAVERALAGVRAARLTLNGHGPEAETVSTATEVNATQLAIWETTLRTALDLLDEMWAAGALQHPTPIALDLALETLALAFHPGIQQRAGSPLVESATRTHALLDRPFIREGVRTYLPTTPTPPRDDAATPAPHQPDATTPTPPRDDAATPASTRPQRLLVLADGKDAFIAAAVDRWKSTPGVEVRFQQLKGRDWNLRETLRLRLTNSPTPIPDFLAADLAWADTVLIEWGEAAAARISGMDFPGRLLVRIHRFEAFTVMPQLFNLRKIDSLIFEVDSVRTAWERSMGEAAASVPVAMVPLECRLQQCALPKLGSWSKTLALVGCGSTVKDPAWALEVLARLRAVDPAWRLHLVGDVLTSSLVQSAEERAYVERVHSALARAGDSVSQLGFRTDIPQVLQHVGVILSSSLVEGTHAAVLEGAASKALPVVRDWPHVAAIGGATANFPQEWVVSSPEEAAERILAWDGRLDDAAQEYVLSRWDESVAGPWLDDVVLGRPLSSRRSA